MTSKDFYLSQAWLREIGAMLKDARLSRGMTQAELANAAGVHQPYIARIETGEYDLKVTTLGLLCSALGMTIDIRQPKGYRNKTVNNNKKQKVMNKTKILFATDKLAREYAESSYEGCTIVESEYGVDVSGCESDESMNEIGGCDGVTNALEVINAEGEEVAVLGYWDVAAEYKIEIGGEISKVLEDCWWAKAKSIAENIAKEMIKKAEEDDYYDLDPEVYVIIPEEAGFSGSEKSRWDE